MINYASQFNFALHNLYLQKYAEFYCQLQQIKLYNQIRYVTYLAYVDVQIVNANFIK